ncbi:MAG: hypothetical protein PHQ33_06665, partial [Bacteroidales bacterium]|nr:hypothetical protein [Bacteroidales bacterium]
MSTLINCNGTLGFEAKFLWDNGIMSRSAYEKNVVRRRIEVLHRSAPGCPAIVSYDSLPITVRRIVDDKLTAIGELKTIAETGTGGKKQELSVFESRIQADPVALNFYSTYKIDDSRILPPETITEYYNNAIVLNAMHDMLMLRKGQRNACGLTGNKRIGLFTSVYNEVQLLDKEKYPHDLPRSERRLRDKYNKYINGGTIDYASLIHPNFCNQNSRKVTEDIKWLILSLYCQKNNPYADWVCEQYLQFLGGAIDVVDSRTGVLFEVKDFCNDNGEPVTLSEATVWNVINAPDNKIIIDSIRMSFHKFGAMSRPHYHRLNAAYSLSKVSLDDRDLPRKLHDGNRVKAYYAYDVCSGVLLGASYSRKKNVDLFVDCIRDMFRTL